MSKGNQRTFRTTTYSPTAKLSSFSVSAVKACVTCKRVNSLNSFKILHLTSNFICDWIECEDLRKVSCLLFVATLDRIIGFGIRTYFSQKIGRFLWAVLWWKHWRSRLFPLFLWDHLPINQVSINISSCWTIIS